MILILLLALASAVFYRMGGTSKGTLWRDVGVSLVTLLAFYILHPVMSWTMALAYFITFGLSWGALSAYWGQDEKPYGFWAHGLGVSLAILPLIIATGLWFGFGLRVVALTAFISLWSQFIGKDWLEEGGRGFAIIATLLLV